MASSSLGYGLDCLRRSPHSSSLLPFTGPLVSSSSSLSLFPSYLFPSASPLVYPCSSLSLFASSLFPPTSSIRIPPSAFLLSTYRHSSTAVLSLLAAPSSLCPPTSSLLLPASSQSSSSILPPNSYLLLFPASLFAPIVDKVCVCQKGDKSVFLSVI